MTEIDETVREFLVESMENLGHLDQELIALEERPDDPQVINHIFRIVHTIKGTCGFFEFKKLEAVSHVGENLLDSLRDRRIVVSQDIITALLSLSDALRTMLVNIEQSGAEGEELYEALRAQLAALNEVPGKKSSPPPAESSGTTAATAGATANGQGGSNQAFPSSEVDTSDELEKIFLAARDEFYAYSENTEQAQVAASTDPVASQSVSSPALSATLETKGPEATADRAPKAAIQSEGPKKSEIADSALRVDVTLLDKLMNLVGELVLARNQIIQFTKHQNDGAFVRTSQRLNLITSELQEGVMRTRMQPIANAWNKLPRIVRDMATLCGKKVLLEMEGKETELDKTIIEAIKDPLTHIIRNAVDHGIESPERRLAAGKRPEGTLSMHAFHEGGQVIIEIADDGAGMNVDLIKKKALDKGIVSEDRLSRMTEQEIHQIVFLPGFSTAEKVTNISGRGVGMDVVRSNIEKIGGTVDISSRFGQGTSFTIKIPLTLAIIPGLIVNAAGHRYAIPQVNLLELVRIEGEQLDTELEEVEGAMFYRLRGKLLPILHLRQELGLPPGNFESVETSVLNIVVVRADNHQFGLVVDAIYDTEEIVVKPLGKLLKGVASFAGATIMGDGRVALILDVAGIGRQAQINRGDTGGQADSDVDGESVEHQKRKLLIFEVNEEQRAAIPLEQVHRLEEFEAKRLERAAGRIVVQYRNGILPLIDLQEALGGDRPSYTDAVRAFVYQNGDSYVGFVVRRIVDIVEHEVNVQAHYRRPGLLGSAIIQGVVTDLVDLQALMDAAKLSATSTSEAACFA